MQSKTIKDHVVTAGVADGIVSEEGKGGSVMEITSNETVAHSAVAGIVTAGADAGVAGAEVVDAEIVEEPGHILVSAAMQIIITPEAKTMYRIEENVREMQQTLNTQTQIMGAIYNEHSLDVLEDIRHKLDVHILEQKVEWTTLSILVDKSIVGTKDDVRELTSSLVSIQEKLPPKNVANKKLISVKEFENLYSIGEETQRQLRGRRKDSLPFVQLTPRGNVLYDVSKINKWMENFEKRRN